MTLKVFSAYHLDILKEIGNIGAGHAATSLSTILNRKINMSVPSVRVVDFNEVMEIIGGPEKVVVSVFLRIEGDATGSMFYLLSPEQANRFVRQLTGEASFSIDQPPYSEISVSAIHELGNILAGSYLTSLSDFTNLMLQSSVPSMAVDMAGSILSFGLIELSQVSDYAIIIDTRLSDDSVHASEDVEGHFLLLPDPDSFPVIFRALGVNEDE